MTLCNRNLSSWTDITDKWVIYLWFACTLGHFQVEGAIWYNIVYEYTRKFGLYNAVSVKNNISVVALRPDSTERHLIYTMNMMTTINFLVFARICRRMRSRWWPPYCSTASVAVATLRRSSICTFICMFPVVHPCARCLSQLSASRGLPISASRPKISWSRFCLSFCYIY